MGLRLRRDTSRNRTRSVVATVLRWYRHTGRALPWRTTRDPYRILIAECMLQQTQVRRVLSAYPVFLARFPTLRALSAATRRQVVQAWQGMGYNNRAIRLLTCARTLVHDYGGRLPREYKTLTALPGIGKYTAHALLVCAFDQQLPIVDVNIRRVLSRVFWRMTSPSETRRNNEVWKFAADILPRNQAYAWNQALMDLGATVCTARKPSCDRCPIATNCRSRPAMKHPPSRSPRSEPSFRGIPNRIYRGRIVKHLCNLPAGTSMGLDTLGKSISSRFAAGDRTWLAQLLNDLEKDGLLTVHGNGSLHRRRVSLT
jgi:A/G-specific adenine glycosylase